MPIDLCEAKRALDKIINKARVDMYKPIQIAEVLYHSRIDRNIDVTNLRSYQNPSIHWRNEITERFTGKHSTSSARYQHDVWNDTAIPPSILSVLDIENKRLHGEVERYIYQRYFYRMHSIGELLEYIHTTDPRNFDLIRMLSMVSRDRGLRRSIDKVYEIVTYSLFETVVNALEATIRLDVSETKRRLLHEFSDLARVLLGLEPGQFSLQTDAHIYRVGVTNSADRGLDMWANFGIAIQVKHLTLNDELANTIVDQVESDHIVIVCTDADARAIETFTRQINWGRRVRGIVKESDLVLWYRKCLAGEFSGELAEPLMNRLISSFQLEFPQTDSTQKEEFFAERGYDVLSDSDLWTYSIQVPDSLF